MLVGQYKEVEGGGPLLKRRRELGSAEYGPRVFSTREMKADFKKAKTKADAQAALRRPFQFCKAFKVCISRTFNEEMASFKTSQEV